MSANDPKRTSRTFSKRVTAGEVYGHNNLGKPDNMSLPTFHMIDGAPQPVATFSHASEIDGWVFLTGQMPTWPDDPDRPIPEGIEAQTRRVMDNLIIVLEGMGLSLRNVAQARVYITDFERDYTAMNMVYKTYFEEGKLPARTCVGVTGLAVGALVEIDMVARRP
jgi:reactive intermediate/imine deaminase